MDPTTEQRDPPNAAESASPAASESLGAPRWSFLSTYAHVLVCLATDREMRLRDIAERVGLTERAVQNIIQELAADGLVHRRRTGRRNRYELHLDRVLQHPLESPRCVADFVDLFVVRTDSARHERDEEAW